MAGDVDKVRSEVTSRVGGANFIERLGDRVGSRISAAAVFGEAIEREGVTVIPVARAAFGFGGGTGEGEGQVGAGGGGGGAVKPVGFIEVRAGGAEFKPLRSGPPAPVVAAALGIAALAIARVTRRT